MASKFGPHTGIYRVKEAAEYLDISKRNVLYLCKAMVLPCTYVGTHRRFHQEDLDKIKDLMPPKWRKKKDKK